MTVANSHHMLIAHHIVQEQTRCRCCAAHTVCLADLQEHQQRYDTALELLGERNEQVDQLEEDIAEMKQIFHEQISVMADQLNNMSSLQATAA